jgi:putative ABC transport system permease protein
MTTIFRRLRHFLGRSLLEIGSVTREGMPATMFVPVAQQAPESFWPTVLLIVNAAPGQRVALERDVAAALTRIDPTIAFTFGTFDQLVEATVTQERLIAMLSAFFGGLALLLAAVGLYGVVAHAVRARQTEIGLRMALGAAPSSVVRLVFQRVGVLIAASRSAWRAASGRRISWRRCCSTSKRATR